MAEGIATSVAEKVVDSMWALAKKEISYMWNCKENVEKFRSEVQKLKDMKGRIEQKVEIAQRKGDNLAHGVQDWVNETDAEILKAEEFLEQESNAKKNCFGIGMCGNWGTLHRYGKKATENAPLLELQVRGTPYESCEIWVDTPTPGRLDVYQNKNLDGIITQNSALGDIISALEDESIQIIGIYGIGGVGKTTLAMEVVARVKNMFAAVAFTTISQTVDATKIEKDIGEATKRISKGEKILIILDDVWEELNLEELCIPCGMNHRNCKIILTSRSEDVCETMNAQSKICVNPLPIEETWILFKHVVSDKVETDFKLKQVAMKVAKECGGLPLIIKAIGNALKNRDVNSWKTALAQLQKNAPTDIAPTIRKAFTHLKLSYDYLENEEVQWCFLQCCMYPEDYKILLEDLVCYGVGLGKFNDLDCMEDARNIVQNAVNILKSSGLLLDVNTVGMHVLGDSNSFIKMHDVVRDVALLIATKDKNRFLVKAGKGLTEWLPRNISQSYTGISLMGNEICKLPEYEIHFPHIETLDLRDNNLSSISDKFIVGMKEARVFIIASNKILSLPESLKLFTKLRMLNLARNESLGEIYMLGELKNLEILILSDTGIRKIPESIGRLVNLRRLEVIRCYYLSHITPGVISKLWRLEEFRIDFTALNDGVYECVVEVMSLSKLTCLELSLKRLDDIPESFNFKKLKGIAIQIRSRYSRYAKIVGTTWTSGCYLAINTNLLVFPFLKWMKNLIEVSCPNIILAKISNLDNIIPDLYQEGFNKLEYIVLWMCPNVSCLVDTSNCDERITEERFLVDLKHLHLEYLENLEVLWKCPNQNISLMNLISLRINMCDILVRLFPASVAQGLVSLKELNITFCMGLEEVIWDETEMDENIIMFPCLTRIALDSLHQLKCFYSGSCTIKYPSLAEVTTECCYRMNKWGPGTHETPKLKFVDDIPLDGPYAINDAVIKSVEAWNKDLSVSGYC